MRLISVKPNWFRAFGDTDEINLDSDLTVLHGPNGFGKSSLSEAIEWLFYGKTKRRSKGEQLSKRDYQGSFRNVHAPAGIPTTVELKVRLTSGIEHTLKRELKIGAHNIESSKTYIDGNENEFPILGLRIDEVYDPILSQDSLKDFIHSKPKERRDRISAAFGLEPLIRFKTVLNSAREKFQRTPPQSISNTKSTVESTTSAMRNSLPVISIADRWASGTFDAHTDLVELRKSILAFLGIETWEEARVRQELQRKREEASNCVFDASPIMTPSDMDNNLPRCRDTIGEIRSNIKALSIALNKFLEAKVSVYSTALLSFWNTGLDLAASGGNNKCPMCEAETLTPEKKEELKERIGTNQGYSSAKKSLEDTCHDFEKHLESIEAIVAGMFPSFLNNKQRTSLIQLFKESDKGLNRFLSLHNSSRSYYAHFKCSVMLLRKRLSDLPTNASNADKIEEVKCNISRLERNTTVPVITAIRMAEKYRVALTEFKILLESRVSEESEVKEIDGMIKPLENWSAVLTIDSYNKIKEETLELVREIEEHILNKQEALFETKGKDIYDWYDLMNPGAIVHYKRIEAGTDSLTIWADTFGKEVNAPACLSESQLNCLGLSIHFTRVLDVGSQFGFILLDDPVQSMDDDHCQALIIDVLKKLLDSGRQVIIFSHVQGLVDSIWETYYDKQPRRLRISDFQDSGPVIEDAETLNSALSRVESLAYGNEDNRRLAVKVLRRCVELLIRENCRKTDSRKPPDSSTANNMISNFQSCPSTTTQQTQGLQNTISFSNPAPHTQQGWAPPTRS